MTDRCSAGSVDLLRELYEWCRGCNDFRVDSNLARRVQARLAQPLAAAQPKQQASGLFLAFTEQEIAAVEALSEYHQLSQLQTMRQALRLYQLSDKRIRDGETMTFSGDVRRAEEFSALAIPSTERDGV